jgi:hypothetical protein
MQQSKQVKDMTAGKIPGQPTPSLTERADHLISTAARAPSVRNTQPWLFKVSEQAVELYADTSRKLHAHPLGREMLISCGAAVLGCGSVCAHSATCRWPNCSPSLPGCGWPGPGLRDGARPMRGMPAAVETAACR